MLLLLVVGWWVGLRRKMEMVRVVVGEKGGPGMVCSSWVRLDGRMSVMVRMVVEAWVRMIGRLGMVRDSSGSKGRGGRGGLVVMVMVVMFVT